MGRLVDECVDSPPKMAIRDEDLHIRYEALQDMEGDTKQEEERRHLPLSAVLHCLPGADAAVRWAIKKVISRNLLVSDDFTWTFFLDEMVNGSRRNRGLNDRPRGEISNLSFFFWNLSSTTRPSTF